MLLELPRSREPMMAEASWKLPAAQVRAPQGHYRAAGPCRRPGPGGGAALPVCAAPRFLTTCLMMMARGGGGCFQELSPICRAPRRLSSRIPLAVSFLYHSGSVPSTVAWARTGWVCGIRSSKYTPGPGPPATACAEAVLWSQTAQRRAASGRTAPRPGLPRDRPSKAVGGPEGRSMHWALCVSGLHKAWPGGLPASSLPSLLLLPSSPFPPSSPPFSNYLSPVRAPRRTGFMSEFQGPGGPPRARPQDISSPSSLFLQSQDHPTSGPLHMPCPLPGASLSAPLSLLVWAHGEPS